MKTKIKSMADALRVIGVEPVEVKFERKKYRKFKFNKKEGGMFYEKDRKKID